MRAACEELRLLGIAQQEKKVGLIGQKAGTVEVGADKDGNQQDVDVGRLYRVAMVKRGVWGEVPREYGRTMVDWPGKKGWDTAWTR